MPELQRYRVLLALKRVRRSGMRRPWTIPGIEKTSWHESKQQPKAAV